MSLLYQTDSRLPDQHHATGCNLMCHLALAQDHLQKYLDPAGVMLATENLRARKLYNSVLKMVDARAPACTIALVGEMLGSPTLRGEQIGVIQPGKVKFWEHVKDFHWHYAIARCKTWSRRLHFVLYNSMFLQLYNPAPQHNLYLIEEYLLYKLWLEQ